MQDTSNLYPVRGKALAATINAHPGLFVYMDAGAESLPSVSSIEVVTDEIEDANGDLHTNSFIV